MIEATLASIKVKKDISTLKELSQFLNSQPQELLFISRSEIGMVSILFENGLKLEAGSEINVCYFDPPKK